MYYLNNIIFSQEFNLVYVNNPKCGCSTIKMSLLNGNINKNVHQDIDESSMFSFPRNTVIPYFSVTRNPYSRILSGYIEKIKEKRDHSIWLNFINKYNLDYDTKLSIYEFLKILAKDDNREQIDEHFRPQIYNLFMNDISYNFLGRLENFTNVHNYLKNFDINFHNYDNHKTNSSEKYKDVISEKEANLICEIFKEDFEILGYDKNLKSNYIPNEIINKENNFSFIFEFLTFSYSNGITIYDLNTFFNNMKFDNQDFLPHSTYNDIIHLLEDFIYTVKDEKKIKNLLCLVISIIRSLNSKIQYFEKNSNNITNFIVDAFRDSALSLENKNIEQAQFLMSISAALRPNGPFIAQKLSEYNELLKSKKGR